MPSFETLAYIFTFLSFSPKGSSNTFKTHKTISLYFKRRYLIIYKYQSMTEPYFRYCSIVRGQCNETLLDKLQTLQNRAAKLIANVSYAAADHNSLLCDYGWLNVHNLILLDLGVFMYKTQKGLAPDVFYDLYHSVTEVDSYDTRSANKRELKEYLIKSQQALIQ